MCIFYRDPALDWGIPCLLCALRLRPHHTKSSTTPGGTRCMRDTATRES